MLKLIFIYDSGANLSIVNNSSLLNNYKNFIDLSYCKLADSNKLPLYGSGSLTIQVTDQRLTLNEVYYSYSVKFNIIGH